MLLIERTGRQLARFLAQPREGGIQAATSKPEMLAQVRTQRFRCLAVLSDRQTNNRAWIRSPQAGMGER